MNDTDVKISARYDVEQCFSFLRNFGFVVQSVDYHPEGFGNWEVTYASKECLIEISNDRGGIDLNFMSLNDKGSRVGIKGMIYYITQGQTFIDYFLDSPLPSHNKQLKDLAILLNEYLAQIMPYFGNDFQFHKEKILLAEKNWYNFAIQQMQMKIKAEKLDIKVNQTASRKNMFSKTIDKVKKLFRKPSG